MKKEQEVKSIKTEWYCDVCGNIDANYRCKCCSKDMCYHCSISDDREMGDRPDQYCKSCWKIGEPFRQKINDIKEEAYKKEEELDNLWFKTARETK